MAHTPGFLRLVEKHFPEAHVTVALASYFKETSEYLKQRFPWIDTIERPFRPNQAMTADYERAFNKAGCVVLNSGMTMSYGYYGLDYGRIMTNTLALMMAREAGKPYGIFGHSFDRMDPPAEILLGGLLSNANFIYLRDSTSLRFLQSKKIKPRVMDFGPDAAFGFDLRDDKKAKEFMQRERLEPGRFIVFIPRVDIERLGGGDAARLPVHAAYQRAVIERYIRETGETVAMVAEVEPEIPKAKSLVYDPLPEDVKKKVVFRSEFWWPDEALSLYVNARSVTSLEMHSVIMSIGAGVPSLHPYYPEVGSKQWMMKDIGLPEWMFDIDKVPPAAISDTLIGIFRDTAGARKRAGAAEALVDSKQAGMMKVVADATRAGRPGKGR